MKVIQNSNFRQTVTNAANSKRNQPSNPHGPSDI